LNDRPGTDVAVVMVDYPPGGSTPPHEHPGFVYAYEKHTEYLPIGHSTSVAARLQALAAPGSIAITEPVRKLVESYFALKSHGPARIKGVSEPLEIYEVTGLGTLLGHFELAARRGLTIFVGRENELAQMRRALEQAMARHGQIVPLVAEAGTEKSRLFYECKATIPAECKVLDAYSVSHGKASAWLHYSNCCTKD
jgi:hypothetical protein